MFSHSVKRQGQMEIRECLGDLLGTKSSFFLDLTTHKTGIAVPLRGSALASPREEGASGQGDAVHWSIKTWSLHLKVNIQILKLFTYFYLFIYLGHARS